MELSRDWGPGFWEGVRDDEYQWPSPQQLEHGKIDPTRCALWMKLCIFFQTQKAVVKNESIDMLVPSHFSVQDGWAFGRDAFYLLAALMGESCRDMSDTIIAQHNEAYSSDTSRKYIGDVAWVRSLSAEKLQSFQASLSESQQRAWEMLREWWNGDYQDANLAAAARVFIKEVPARTIDYIGHRDSLYQAVLFSLFDAELSPSGWTTGTSRGQDRNRSMAFEHAVAQKAGFLLLKELRPGFQSEATPRLPQCYDSTPWLPKSIGENKNPNTLPLYLWDTVNQQTKRVQDLLDQGLQISYTCISHTWGRKKKQPLSTVRVSGVEWEIPENTLFDVTELPEIISNAKIIQTRFVWFDLLCLPQDTSSPEYLSEVSRQATIFHHASSCLAWINTVTSWDNLAAAIRWLTLHFLYAGSATDIYGVRELLQEASQTARSSIELIMSSSEFALWISSTWTLQESCLCPDILLLNRAWEPLMIAPESYVSLHHLLTLYSVNREAYFEQPISIDDWPLGPQQLHYVQAMVTGLDVAISRVGILTLGATRECERRRADAVMSAINVTDWYTEYLNRHGEPPPDKDLILGSYPLAFLDEAAAKLGSYFFSTIKPDILTLEPEDVHGSLLPFGPPGWSSSSGLGLGHDWYGDTTDHPSLAAWKIGVDGSVLLNEAAVLLSSASNHAGTSIRAVVNSALEIGGTQVQECDLYEYLSSVTTPPGRTRLAVVTSKMRDVLCGIILQELSLSSSSQGSGACWASIGVWDTRFVQDFPPTESLGIKVL